MSWSRQYGPGLLAALILQARDEAPSVKAGLPDFEHEQVDVAIEAAEAIGQKVPEGATVSLSLAGHGWRNTVTGEGSGNVSVNVGYSLAATAPLQPPEAAPAAGGPPAPDTPAPDAPAADPAPEGGAVEGTGSE